MKKIVFLAGMLSATIVSAQDFNFEEKANALGLPTTKEGSLAYGVINGKKAVLMTGNIDDGLEATKLYLYNTDRKVFEQDTTNTFAGIKLGQAIFVDVDNDGDSDIALIGQGWDKATKSNKNFFHIYENNGGTFTLKQDLTAEGLSNSSMDAGDYNGDGNIDLLITGVDKSFTKSTFIYDNNAGTFSKNTTATFTGITEGDAKFLDANKDGKLDVVLSGKKADYDGTVEVYTQDATGGTFTKTQDFYSNDYGYEGANIAVGDVNGLGFQDFVVIGRGYTGASYVFDNDTEATDDDRFGQGFQLPNLKTSNGKNGIILADLDGDGKKDIVFASGKEGGDAKTYIYRNTMGDAEDFVEYTDLNITFGESGSVLAFDYDDDGDLDLFVTGADNYGGTNAKFFENKKTTLANNDAKINKADVKLYPNPVVSTFSISGVEKVAQVSVYDMSGRLVKSFSAQNEYNVSNLSKGNYIVVVKGDNATQKFTIVKK